MNSVYRSLGARPAERGHQSGAVLAHRDFVPGAVLGEQREEKIGVAEPGPGDIAGKLCPFAASAGSSRLILLSTKAMNPSNGAS